MAGKAWWVKTRRPRFTPASSFKALVLLSCCSRRCSSITNLRVAAVAPVHVADHSFRSAVDSLGPKDPLLILRRQCPTSLLASPDDPREEPAAPGILEFAGSRPARAGRGAR